ncbi:hypothetical protein M2475_001622 [Breznakia sp. PF5-3]|nr:MULTISPECIES: hypothetical protein [unclassified Breznakia]MDF9825188.1 hypothetical protein [Breznakia sp. PM6-1]MDF9836046.1 hypothetical protein [Breznakia sp. PF5-3]MDF9838593.1 hypothetical protein [Breznakia sp. PFB2-8]MDF9860638.1 hypothetical protein [Breznakia sp. PH5-24]
MAFMTNDKEDYIRKCKEQENKIITRDPKHDRLSLWHSNKMHGDSHGK